MYCNSKKAKKGQAPKQPTVGSLSLDYSKKSYIAQLGPKGSTRNKIMTIAENEDLSTLFKMVCLTQEFSLKFSR